MATTPPAISLLPTPLARTYTLIHPLLLLTLSSLLFPDLVATPVQTLTRSLPPLALLQSIHAIVCLPARHRSAPKPTKTRKRPTHHAGRDLRSKIVPTLLAHTLTFSLALPALFTLLVLFGAPLTTHLRHTTLLAAHMAQLGAFPLFYAHGLDRRTWVLVAAAGLAGDEVWGGAVGCVVGAWVGAVPVPLDWDREWQKWPITIVTGAYLGWVVGRVVGGSLLRGKRISFD